MKKYLSEPKHLMLFILDMIPYAVRVILFRCGGPLTTQLLWPCILILMALNGWLLKGVRECALMQGLMAVGTVISGGLFTALYCFFVSNDPMSAPVGLLITILELMGIGLVTGVLVLFKRIKQ